MRRFAVLLALLIAGVQAASADTLSHWSVQLNDSLILWGGTAGDSSELRLQARSLEPFDVISIRYCSDVPCVECLTEVVIENGRKEPVARSSGRGTGTPVEIQAYELLRYENSGAAGKLLNVFYMEEGRTARPGPLFRIRLE